MIHGISNAGAGEQYATYRTSLLPTDVNKAVCFVGNDEVGLGTDGAEVAGQLVRVESDGVCTVQVAGYMKLDYAVAPTLGGKVVSNGAGKVKPAASIDPTATTPQIASGRGIVSSVDATTLTAGLFLY